jgi:RNA polymerase sigma factor (sigma-70 family)
MAKGLLSSVLGYLRGLTASGDAAAGDALLLRRFARSRDEAAFAALVRRHGPMVWGVCRRLLRDPQDAEDAFQAAFLVLARKAGAVGRPERLANWLYGAALRTARKARVRAAKRQAARVPLADVAAPEEDAAGREALAALDEEVRRLPDQYRAPLVLCCLEGKSRDQAAHELGWSAGAVKGRLERGRELLRGRLVRRGVGPNLAALAAPAVTAALLTAAARAGVDAAAVSPTAAALANRILRMMTMKKVVITAAVTLLLGAAGAGVVGLLRAAGAAPRPIPAAAAAPAPAEPPSPWKESKFKLDGPTAALAFSQDGKRLAAGGEVGVVHVWGTDGREVAALKAGKDAVAALQFAPDDKSLVAGHVGGELRLWDVDKAAEIWAHKDDDMYSLNSVVFSADGKTLVGAGHNNRALVWDAGSGKKTGEWRANEMKGTLSSVAVSGDGKLAVAGGRVVLNEGTHWNEYTVRDASGKALATVRGEERPLAVYLAESDVPSPVAVAADGKAWAAAFFDLAVRVYDADGKELASCVGHKGAVTALAFLSDGKALVSAGRDGKIRVWDAATGKEKKAVEAGQGKVLAMALSADGKTLATAGADGTVIVRGVAGLMAEGEKP